ncbi:putative phosphohydrolase [Terriglobus roseus DSM 18391]|uniref:Putative phosphohydrolase n=1 Tax=Terriglobus roseus (strain DSM 18391 / NRRL B-41598 / KBS 63) TaxID=926566 RepID=I3ZIZ1_TERRK|nr:metallophosphoesterase [Terriglobus roseus]AFL89209.1 putative phosphohydrolase [Terriglobus roseus DSM 18391]
MDLPLTRRGFLKTTFAFSAAAMLAGCETIVRPLVEAPINVMALGDWGWVGDLTAQHQVASAMQSYVRTHALSPNALLMLGDNFYGELPGGVSDPRWQSQFETIYPSESYNCPVYAVPGNHDYQNDPQSKYEAELAYSALGTSRWTMPSRYYKVLLPAKAPLITCIMLDSNMGDEPAQPHPRGNYYAQTDAERREQLAWLTQTLAEPLETPFLAVIAHHPLYTNGAHGDNQTLIRDWDPLLRKAGVHLYLAGHDHDMQHLEFAGHPTSFVLSGGGGAALNRLKSPSDGPFAAEVHGFTHLQISEDLVTVTHLDENGNTIHSFSKTPSGVVTLLS